MLSRHSRMSTQCSWIVSSEELAHRANASQVRARKRPARPEDAFLITLSADPIRSDDATGTVYFGNRDHDDACKYIARHASRKPKEGEAEKTIRTTLEPQDPTGIAKFPVRGSYSESDTLPGRAPIVDHLYNRASVQKEWGFLIPPLDVIRSSRCPDMSDLPTTVEVTIGKTSDDDIQQALHFLRQSIQRTRESFFFAQLSGDLESIGVTPSTLSDLKGVGPNSSLSFSLAKRRESATKLPTKLMIGHLGWQVVIRLPYETVTGDDGSSTLEFQTGAFNPLISTIIKEAGPLIGIGIADDLDLFSHFIEAVYSVKVEFQSPVELQSLVRLAGYNIPRHGVASLVWVFLGGLLPKGYCSAADAKWHLAWDSLPKPFKAYLSGDICQVAAVAWVAISAWFVQVFADPHATLQMCMFTTVKELLSWWATQVIAPNMPAISSSANWYQQVSRPAIMDLAIMKTGKSDALKTLTPDWPTVTAGGCRFFHSARAFIVAARHPLREFEASKWPELYREQYHLLTFQRCEVSPSTSPTDPVQHDGLRHNPALRLRLVVPPDQVNQLSIARATGKANCVRSVIMEYVRSDLQRGAVLLSRLEASPTSARDLLPKERIPGQLIRDIREMLADLNHLPPRPVNWVDHYPDPDPADKITRISRKASALASRFSKKAQLLLKASIQISKAVTAATDNPPSRTDHRWDVNNLVHPRRPGKAKDEHDVVMRMGASGSQVRPLVNPHFSPSMTVATPLLTSCSRPETVTSGEYRLLLAGNNEDPHQDSGRKRVSAFDRLGAPEPKRHQLAAAGFTHIQPPNLALAALPLPTSQSADYHGFTEVVDTLAPLSIDIRQMFIVGGEQARRLSHAMSVAVPRVEVRYLSLTSPTPEGFSAATSQLSSYSLGKSLVVLWLYDQRSFMQQEDGSPLEVSSYDLSLHCPGSIRTVSRPQFFDLLDESRQLVTAAQAAPGSILISPLPFFLGQPCCELLNHCSQIMDRDFAVAYCEDVARLRDYAASWINDMGFNRTTAIVPHKEILIKAARNPSGSWLQSLRQACRPERVHFTREGYSQLAAQLWHRIETRYSDDHARSSTPSSVTSSHSRRGSLDSLNHPPSSWGESTDNYYIIDSSAPQVSTYHEPHRPDDLQPSRHRDRNHRHHRNDRRH